jgi:RHS repeat-associated protein
VRDVTTSNTTDEAYGADGAVLWRYTGSSTDPNQRSLVPFQGRVLAEYYGGSPGGMLFDHPDEIGSLTIGIDYATSHSAERLFYPFGELWTGAAIPNLNMHQTFAQLPDYDSETDQYNTPNRHYNPTGRWLSPDPGGLNVVRLDDPQTWNMYAYARNNPTTVTDPSGLQTVSPVAGTTPCISATCAEAQSVAGSVDPSGSGEPSGDQPAGEGHGGPLGLVLDWLDVVEVSGSYGLGVSVGGQLGVAEGTLGIGVETQGTIGLGGGNGEMTTFLGAAASGEAGPAEAGAKVGVTVSSSDGVSAGAEAHGAVGPVGGTAKVDSTGFHAYAGVQKTKDTKLGGHAHVGVGVGANVNLSQAKRAYQNTARDLNALANYLIHRLIPSGVGPSLP